MIGFLSITEARGRFNGLVEEVEAQADGLYVLTKGGTPVVAVVNVGYLERLMEAAGMDKAVGQASPLPGQMIEHVPSKTDTPTTAADAPEESDYEGGPLTVVGGLD